MNRILTSALALAFVFAMHLPAQAEDVDMAKVSCKDFISMQKDEMAAMLFWIDGFMSQKSENTVISDEWMEKLGAHLGSYCGANPQKTIMNAMEAMPSE